MPSALGNESTGNTTLPALFSHDKPQAKLPNPRDGLDKDEFVITGGPTTAQKRIPYNRLMINPSIRSNRQRKNKLRSTSAHRGTWPMQLNCFNSCTHWSEEEKDLVRQGHMTVHEIRDNRSQPERYPLPHFTRCVSPNKKPDPRRRRQSSVVKPSNNHSDAPLLPSDLMC